MVDRNLLQELDHNEALDNEALPSVVEKDGVNLARYAPLAFLVVVGIVGSWIMISGMQGGEEQPDYVAPGASEFSTGVRGGDDGVYAPPFGLGREQPEEPEPEATVVAPQQQETPPPRADPLRGFAERQRLELERRREEAALARQAEQEAFERERRREQRRLTAELERRNEEIMRQRRRAPAVVFDESENEEW